MLLSPPTRHKLNLTKNPSIKKKLTTFSVKSNKKQVFYSYHPNKNLNAAPTNNNKPTK